MRNMCPEGGETMFLQNIISIYTVLEITFWRHFVFWDTENIYGLSDKNI